MTLASLDRTKFPLNHRISVQDLILLIDNVNTIVHRIQDSFKFIPFKLQGFFCLLALSHFFLPAHDLILCLYLHAFITDDEGGADRKGQNNDPEKEQVFPRLLFDKAVTLS